MSEALPPTTKIMMPLLSEGTPVWMPVDCAPDTDGLCVMGPEPEDVIWKYPPGTLVQCEDHIFHDGISRPTATLAPPGSQTLFSHVSLPSSAEQAFSALVEKQHVEAWWGAPDQFRTTFTNELRDGGAWRAEFKAPDDSVSSVYGVYRRVARPDALVMTYQFSWVPDDPPIEAAFEFYDRGDGTCNVALTQTGAISDDLRDDPEGGWSVTLAFLRAYLARRR